MALYSALDQQQVLQRSFNESSDKLRVEGEFSIGGGPVEVVITQENDSIRLGDGTTLFTGSTVSGRTGLDVNVIGGVVSGDFTTSGLSKEIKTQRVTITDVRSKVPLTPLADRNSISVRVMGANEIYFGSSNVSSANGYVKYEREEIVLDIKDSLSVELYAVCKTGESCEIAIMEVA